jgi:hypothetical protein
MKFVFLCAPLIILLAGCNNYEKNASTEDQTVRPEDALTITSKDSFVEEIYNSYQFDDGIIKGLPGQGIKSVDSIGISQARGYSFPASSKVVIWHSISYVVNGSGRLTIVCSDSTDYEIPLPRDAVAAVSSLMQSKAIRYDTSDAKIYTYKTALRGF